MFNRKKIKNLELEIERLEKQNRRFYYDIQSHILRERDYSSKEEFAERKIKDLEKENDRLKLMLPRAKILGMMSYENLVKLAETDYGIKPHNYEDKADLISEIIEVEKQIKKMGACL